MVKIILLFLIPLSLNAQYRITKQQIWGWSITAVAGTADGLCEGFDFDKRRSFERKYNVSPYGYFGSKSYTKVYIDNDVKKGFKPGLYRLFGAQDFYHHADDVRKIGYMTGTMVLTLNTRKKWHYLVDFGISFGISSFTKSLALRWIRS